MGFTWFKKGTFEKLANLVRSIGYPIALQNKLDESLGKDYLPQEIPPEQKPKPLVSFDTEFKPTEVAPTTETPAPQGDENKTLSEDIANLKPQTLQETPVPTTTGTPTKDLSGIQTILQSQESAKSWNKKVQRDYLDFLKYASGLGDEGKKFIDVANYLAQGSMKEIPKLTNIDPKQVMKDKNGDAYMLYLNPMGGTVKQSLGVKFDEIVQPKFNKDMLHFEMGDDGNAVIRNLENGTTVNTGIPFGQFDTKWDIQNKLYNLKEAHDLGMLDIAQQKLLKSGKGGEGDGDGTTGKSNYIVIDKTTGQPVNLGDVKDANFENLIKGLTSTNDKVRKQSLQMLKDYYPNYSVINPEIGKRMKSNIQSAYQDVVKGKRTQEEYNAYLDKLMQFDPATFEHIYKPDWIWGMIK